MAKLSTVIEGLKILQKYEGDDDLCAVRAEHDVIYAGGPAGNAFTAEDLVELEELGWHWDADVDSWRRFT